MLSKKTVLGYQRMTPSERFEIAAALQDGVEAHLDSLPPERQEFLWRVIRRMHDQFSERVLAHLAKHDR